MTPISVSHLTVLDASPEDFVRAAGAAGFDAVGLRVNPPPHTPTQWPVAGDVARTRALRAICDDCGVSVLECEGYSIRPTTSIEGYRPGLEAAAVLGCRYVLSAGMDPDESRMIDRYGELTTAAQEFGLVVGIEFISWNAVRTLADARRVLAKVGASNAGILVDFLHLARTGGTPANLEAVPPEDFAYAQICDATRTLAPGADLATEARTHRFYPGEGELPLADIVAALPPHIAYTLEAPSARHVGMSLTARMRDAFATMRGFFDARERAARLPG